MNKENRDFHIDVDIDVYDILGENLTHASKCQYYGDRLADAILERDTAKSNLKLVEAELGDTLLRNWQQYYESKPSESVKSGWIIQQSKYKIALDKYNKSEHYVNILKSADKAFEARGYSLGHITSSLISGFSSVPKIGKIQKKQATNPHLKEVEPKERKVFLKKPTKI
jgi:hypothetical protein